MNKKEFIHALSEQTGFSKVDAKKALEGSLAIITEQMKLDSKVAFISFGSFSVQRKSARKSINPRTLKPMNIPAKNIVRFKPSKLLNQSLEQPKRRGRKPKAEISTEL